MWTGFSEFLKGEKSFYRYTKQTILHLLYRVLIVCMVFTCFLIFAYLFASEDKASAVLVFLAIFAGLVLIEIVLIIWLHIYYVHVKCDVSPLQSEQHQIIKEMLTKVQGDSMNGMVVIDAIKTITQEGENQNGKLG